MLPLHQQLQRRSPLKCQLLYNEFYRQGHISIFSPTRINASNHLCSTRRSVISNDNILPIRGMLVIASEISV